MDAVGWMLRFVNQVHLEKESHVSAGKAAEIISKGRPDLSTNPQST
jgi:hypothetical protein